MTAIGTSPPSVTRSLVADVDLKMPDIDGFEVLKIVRSEFPHFEVLVISGYLEGALLKAAECLGASLSLDKANAPRLLVETTRKLLGDTN